MWVKELPKGRSRVNSEDVKRNNERMVLEYRLIKYLIKINYDEKRLLPKEKVSYCLLKKSNDGIDNVIDVLRKQKVGYIYKKLGHKSFLIIKKPLCKVKFKDPSKFLKTIDISPGVLATSPMYKLIVSNANLTYFNISSDFNKTLQEIKKERDNLYFNNLKKIKAIKTKVNIDGVMDFRDLAHIMREVMNREEMNSSNS
jgi:hypothetical protein